MSLRSGTAETARGSLAQQRVRGWEKGRIIGTADAKRILSGDPHAHDRIHSLLRRRGFIDLPQGGVAKILPLHSLIS